MLTEFQDQELVQALRRVRDTLLQSPTATGIGIGLGYYIVRRKLMCGSFAWALASGLVMGLSAASAVAAANNVRPQNRSAPTPGAASSGSKGGSLGTSQEPI